MIKQEEFLNKKAKLEMVRRVLKTEYFGIDVVIDQIMDAMSSWYYFNDLQEKPLIINLWGLTGTGKTSLVKRMIALLELEKGFFTYDSRESHGEKSITSIMEAVNRHYRHQPVTLLIDEFQHSRTINDQGEEDSKRDRVDFWELLDSGEIALNINARELSNIWFLISELTFKIATGLKGVNGIITVESSGLPESALHRREKEDKPCEPIIDNRYHDIIALLHPERFADETEVTKYVLTLDERESLALLEEVYEVGKKPKNICINNALIFIAGNLDEAYRMYREIEQEVDADEMYEQSKKINLSEIKLSLQRRFRNEQIARLGNIHIIYPSLNRRAYEQIIKKEIDKVADFLQEQAGLSLEYDKELFDKIYEEGVAPAQGTRPLFSTIHLWLRGQMGTMLIPVIEKGLSIDHIRLKYVDKKVEVFYCAGKKIVHQGHYSPYSFNDQARQNKEPGLRYIVAVHEAGHIIASIKLLNYIPKNATSLSVSATSEGFVSIQKPKSYYEKDIGHWLATLLAGGVAERQVFGDKHVPMGTSEDHRIATSYIVELIKTGSLNEVPGIYANRGLFSELAMHDDANHITRIAEKWLQKGQTIARELLIRYEKELVILAEQLLNKNYLRRADLTEFADQYLNHHLITTDSAYEDYFKQKLASVKQPLTLPSTSTDRT